jgi:hypothetical protein
MASQTYRLFRTAILESAQVTCVYRGHPRALCPHIIGHSDGAEVVLAFQFAGGTNSTLPPGGAWRCLHLAEVEQARLRAGPWRSGAGDSTRQHCVTDVDLDITAQPGRPRRRTR